MQQTNERKITTLRKFQSRLLHKIPPDKALVGSMLLLLLGGCSLHNPFVPEGEYVLESLPPATPVVSRPIKSENMYRATMKPYCVKGETYCPTAVTVGEKFRGTASWYGPNFHGALTSNGERYNMYDYTAAHKTLPINTIVHVTNLQNGKETTVRINDRGPFVKDRIIDLSYQAAQDIGLIKHGTAPVELEVVSFDHTATKYAHKGAPAPLRKPSPQTASVAQTMIQKPETVIQRGGFSVQIASFSDRNKAEMFKTKCYNGTQKHPIVIHKKDIGNRPIYSVLITGFIGIDEAKAYIRKYGYKEAFVVRD